MSKWYILGILYDVYCPAMQARLYRDLLDAKRYAELHKRRLLVACPDLNIAWLLGALSIRHTVKVGVAANWLIYNVDSVPETPTFAKSVTNIKVSVPKRSTSRLFTGPTPNPHALLEQGRDATFTSLKDRPTPNGYTPHSPASIAIFFGT